MKTGDRTYSVFINSNTTLKIASPDEVIAKFSTESDFDFDMEIRVYY